MGTQACRESLMRTQLCGGESVGGTHLWGYSAGDKEGGSALMGTLMYGETLMATQMFGAISIRNTDVRLHAHLMFSPGA